VQEVALAKGEIFAGLGAGGVAVFNADDAQARPLARAVAGRRIVTSASTSRRTCAAGFVRCTASAARLQLETPQGRA
jgi:UDP-N-acetylmuramoyl-tripeptide--D-alanyl-D-alanine ligase